MPEVDLEDEPPFSLKRLEPTDTVRGLSLGHADFKPLKTFFEKHAKAYERNSLCRTYATVKNETGKIVGYVSIICGEVLIEKGQPLDHDGEVEFNYEHYPAIKIARLAVDKRYRGNDLGRGLVDFALGVAKEYICPHIGCRFAVVDAKQQSIEFYERCGFTMLDTEANRERSEPVMFIDLAKI